MNKSEIERIQRNTVNAEQSLIGAVLVDNGLMNEIKVTSDNFFLSGQMVFSQRVAPPLLEISWRIQTEKSYRWSL